MFKSKTGLLFLTCCLIPYAQVLLQPHEVDLLLDFLALVGLIISTCVLVYRTRFSSRCGLYPVVALGAVSLYFLYSDSLHHTGEYIAFKRQQPQLEKFVAELDRSPQPDSLIGLVHGYPLPGIISYEIMPDGTYLFTQGGHHSASFWGVAYARNGQAPTYHNYTIHYSYLLEGQWYMWFRFD